jgi:hypothetical protein
VPWTSKSTRPTPGSRHRNCSAKGAQGGTKGGREEEEEEEEGGDEDEEEEDEEAEDEEEEEEEETEGEEEGDDGKEVNLAYRPLGLCLHGHFPCDWP